MIRKPRRDKGKKRLGSRIRRTAGSLAKYGAGLYVGSKIYNAGSRLGTGLSNKTISRIAPNAATGGGVDRAKNLARAATTMVVADQTVRAVNKGTEAIVARRKERKERRGNFRLNN